MKRNKLFKSAAAVTLALTTVLSNIAPAYAADISAGGYEEPAPTEDGEESTNPAGEEQPEETPAEAPVKEAEEPTEDAPAAPAEGEVPGTSEEDTISDNDVSGEDITAEETDSFAGVVAPYGSPLVDGAVDEIWSKAKSYDLLQARNSATSSATAKLMWDDNALYVLVDVKDATLDKASGNAYEQDSVEVFLDELNDRSGAYGSDDAHYRVNFDNERSTDSGEEGRWYTKTTVTEEGYIVEGCIKWESATPDNDALFGFDAQINCAEGGSRKGELSLFATSGDGYQDTSLFGEVKLTGKTADDVTPGFPYSLYTYLEKVKAIDLSVYVNGEEAKALIAEVEAFLAAGGYTQAEIDAYYDKLVTCVNTLDDGSGYLSPLEMAEHPELPDIFTFYDGTTKVTAENWEARKKEIKEYYDYYMYGPYPDTSDEIVSYEVTGMTEREVTVTDPVTGEKKKITVKQGTLKLTVERGEAKGTVSMTFVVPTTEAPEGGYPFYSEMSGYAGDTVYYAASRGMAVASWTYTDFASDDLSRTGLFYTIHPYGTHWKEQTGALVAWSWGAGKILDALENGLAAEYNINPEINMLAGVSRLGKATAVAGAYDERIKYIDPTCSGAGGMATFRYSSEGKTYDGANIGLNHDGVTTVTVDQNEGLGSLQASGEIFWFNDNFAKFKSVNQLPFDQYYLASLMADEDRYLMITAGLTGENWTNSAAMSLTYLKAREVYRMLGLDDHIFINVHETNDTGSTPNHKIITMDLAYFIDVLYQNEYGVAPTTDQRKIKSCVYFEDVNWDPDWDSLAGNNVTSVDADKYVKKATVLDHGVSVSDIEAALPKVGYVYVDDARYRQAAVTWDVAGSSFDASTNAEQEFIVNGTLTLPEGVVNDQNLDLSVQAKVVVLSKPDDLAFGDPYDDDWNNASVYELKNVVAGSETGATGTVKLLYDDENLYIKAEIADADVTTKEGASDKEDGIAFTFAKGLKAGSDVVNILFTADGDAVTPTYSANFDWNTWGTTITKSYKAVSGVTTNVSTTDAGWSVEAIVPLSVLKLEADDTDLAFEAILTDCDADGNVESKRALFLRELPYNEITVGSGWTTGKTDGGLFAENLHASKIKPVSKYGIIIADGEIENTWDASRNFNLNNLIDETAEGVDTTDGDAKVKVMWDDTYLYVFADITDSDVYSDGDSDEEEDSFAFTVAGAPDGTAKKFVVTADGEALSEKWTGSFDFSTFGGKASRSYNKVDSVFAETAKTDKGWQLEACVSFAELGFTPVNGAPFYFEAVVNNATSTAKKTVYRKALFATSYPVNNVTISGVFYGMFSWTATYNAGFIAKDLTEITFGGKRTDKVTEDIGRYTLLNKIKSFYKENVEPYPIKTSYDEEVINFALTVAKDPFASMGDIEEQIRALDAMSEKILADNHYGKLMSKAGTPLVDGVGDDEVWENAYTYKTGADKKGQFAEIKSLWDEKAVYFLVTVWDPTYDVAGSDAHQKDSVEFFIIPTEDSAKNSFGRDGGQWRINRANVTTVTFGDNEPFYAKLTEIEGGYVVEARYEFAESMNIKALSELSLDIAVNLCEKGSRTDSVAWASGDCYSNPNKAGKMVFLADEAGEGSVRKGYDPYVLMKVLDKALLMERNNYDAASFDANYDRALLEKYRDEALSGTLSGETIDEYYANVIEMMSEITYDGVHKSVLGFKENADYPDVFTMEDGTKVNTDDKWSLRHDEIQDLYEFYMYGKLPKAEETGLEKSFSQSGSNYVITVSRPGIDAASFSFKVYMPEGEAPEGGWPYIINYGGNISGAQDAGYAVIDYSAYGDVASNDSYYNGVFYKMYPECKGNIYTTGVGPLAARAWGAGLIIDCIEEGIGELAKLNPENSAVTGFSFLGKTALVTGVLEDRIKVTNPEHSGVGGAAPFRYSAQGKYYTTEEYGFEKDHLVTKIEPIGQVQGQGMAWVKTIFADFLGGDCTPFDTYMLLSLVAPRGLFVSAGYYDNGTNPEGMYAAYVQAREVYKFLGIEGKIAFGDYPTDHAQSSAEYGDLFKFCDYIMYGKELPEDFYNTVFDNSSDRAEYDVIRAPKKVKSGVVEEDGKLYYYSNGKKAHRIGLVEWKGDYYYVLDRGTLATGFVGVTNTHGLLDMGTYEFGSDGKLIMKNGFVEENGSTYYYVNGRRGYAGLIEVDGNLYYVKGTGEIAKGRYYISNTNGLLPRKDHAIFDTDGKFLRYGKK
ncbi:MAG: hypothetical protein J5717_10525 [Lachnospiraceae bacterium]|nr:hypothetical protein [Lachnospiraceae bacterium]